MSESSTKNKCEIKGPPLLFLSHWVFFNNSISQSRLEKPFEQINKRYGERRFPYRIPLHGLKRIKKHLYPIHKRRKLKLSKS